MAEIEQQLQELTEKLTQLGLQVAGFNTNLDALKGRVDTAEAKLKDLDVKLSAFDDIDDFGELGSDLKVIKKQLAALGSQAVKLSAPAADEAKPKLKLADLKPVEVDGVTYKFGFAKFKVPGFDHLVTAQEAATDEAILKSILKIDGQGILIPQA